jgi:2,3-bisphosphoglycerate-dependent phosphoglycerate mutase
LCYSTPGYIMTHSCNVAQPTMEHLLTNTIFLVRHAENRANITKEFSHRRVDYFLTDKGILQAQQTAERVRALSIDEIYSSPLKRAAQTAGIIAAACSLPVTTLEAFRETNTGVMEDRPATMDDWRYHNGILNAWYDGKPAVRFPGGEDYLSLLSRARSGFTHVLTGKEGRRIVIVGHGGMFATTLKDICDNVDVAWLRHADAANCSITQLEVTLVNGEPRGRLLIWGESGHLHGWAAALIPGIPGRAEDFGAAGR